MRKCLKAMPSGKRSRFHKVKPMLGMNNPPISDIHLFLQKLISRCDQFSRSNRHGFWLYWEIQSRRVIFPLQATSKKIVLPDDMCSNRGSMQKTLALMDPAVATMR